MRDGVLKETLRAQTWEGFSDLGSCCIALSTSGMPGWWRKGPINNP